MRVTRVFSDDKTIDSPGLNAAGIQPFRILAARLAYALRDAGEHPLRAELMRSGMVICDQFLPPAEFDAWRKEAFELMATSPPTWQYRDGTTELDQFLLGDVDQTRFPHAGRWPRNPQIISLIEAAERRRISDSDGLRVVEHMRFGDYSTPDSQTELHVDTFFSTHKAWLYLDDVTPDNAPFVYVPGSHVDDRVRLRYEYAESRKTNRGSRRVSDDEVGMRGMERRVVTCPRNTLVVANTHGYHSRSVAEPGTSRRAFHMSFRFNPFSLGSR